MAAVGDRVQVPSKRVGQPPRDGVVTGVSGGLLRVTWSGGEESTIMPSMGSLFVVGTVRSRAKKAEPTRKAASKKAASKKTLKKAAKAVTRKTATKKSIAKTTKKTATKKSAKKAAKSATKTRRAGVTKPAARRSGKAGKRRK